MNNIKINHLYSNNLNIYGDIGNIFALRHRAKILGISTDFVHNEIGDDFLIESDIYFIGGGQDNDQINVFQDLLKHKDFIKTEVDKGKIFILICGGYQLFGKYFLDANGNIIEGLNILDIETKAQDSNVTSRCIGNLIVEMNEDFINHWKINTVFSKFLVGFENHGGQTFIKSNKLKEIGKVIQGFGNNSLEKIEGSFYKNIIGCYLHGSLLPKNPHLTDAILLKASNINQISDLKFVEIEKLAHENILNKKN